MQENATPELQKDLLSDETGNTETLYTLMWLPVVEIERSWAEAEFQSKLFCLLLGWLSINIVFIRIAWSRYGTRLYDSFITGSSRSSSEERTPFSSPESTPGPEESASDCHVEEVKHQTIKRFFEKKKLDVKFKKAGGGHKLTEDTRDRSGPSLPAQSQRPAAAPTQATKTAAEAALARMNQPSRPGTSGGGATNALRSQISREMEAERKAQAQARSLASTYSAPREVELEGAPVLTVTGVFYKCPLLGPLVLTKDEMEAKITEFLLSQLAEEPQMTSALMIYTLNKDSTKIKVGIETITKYLDNIIANPQEEKFRRIRVNNKAFQEKVLQLEGSQEFLQSVGFEMKLQPGPNQVEEDFYVLDEERAMDTDNLKAAKDVLLQAEPIKPELDHNVKVFYPSSSGHRIQVPETFYSISPEELKKEQQLRQEAVDKFGMLRTKEMRERERQRELRRYRFTLIRVRFPDGILLQGTFRALDKLKSVTEFVRECLVLDWIPFTLATTTGQKLTDENMSLAELDLAPAACVVFEFDKSVMAEITAQQGSKIDRFLKDELLQHLEYT